MISSLRGKMIFILRGLIPVVFLKEVKMTQDEIDNKIKTFLNSADDLIANLCYYDRKEDEDLSRSDVETLLSGGHLTMTRIFDRMKLTLKQNFENIKD